MTIIRTNPDKTIDVYMLVKDETYILSVDYEDYTMRVDSIDVSNKYSASLKVGHNTTHIFQKLYSMNETIPDKKDLLIRICKNLAREILMNIHKDNPLAYVKMYDSYFDLTIDYNAYIDEQEKERIKKEELKKQNVCKLEDVILPKEIKKEILLLINMINNKEKYEAIGLDMSDSFNLLLYGKPGTGKTLIARSIAQETNRKFKELEVSEVINRYVGDSSKAIKNTFDELKDEPSILFVDEIDSFCVARSGETNAEYRSLINEFLKLMTSPEYSDIIIIGTTNCIDQLDEALLRSGRFDKKIEIKPPDKKARKELFELYVNKLKHNDNMQYNKFAKDTDGLTGADIQLIVRLAAIHCVDDGLDKVDNKHIISEIKKITNDSDEVKIEFK